MSKSTEEEIKDVIHSICMKAIAEDCSAEKTKIYAKSIAILVDALADASFLEREEKEDV